MVNNSGGVLERVNLRLVKEFNLINENRKEFNKPSLNWNEFTERIVRHITWPEIRVDIINVEKKSNEE
jgi:hypothetical protein